MPDLAASVLDVGATTNPPDGDNGSTIGTDLMDAANKYEGAIQEFKDGSTTATPRRSLARLTMFPMLAIHCSRRPMKPESGLSTMAAGPRISRTIRLPSVMRKSSSISSPSARDART